MAATTRCQCKDGHADRGCEDICVRPPFSLRSPNYAGVLSEHVIKRYEVQGRHPKDKMSPALHNTDLEQKKPRRKDTPALNPAPWAAGKKCRRRPFAGGVGNRSRASPSGGGTAMAFVLPSNLCCSEVLREEPRSRLPFSSPLTGGSPGADLEVGEGWEHRPYFSRTGQIH